MVIQNLLSRLTQPVDAQRVLSNPLYNIGALLSPDVAAQTPRLSLLAQQQEQQERRRQLEDFYRQLGGLPAPAAGDTDAPPAAGAGIPPSGIPPGMGGLVGQPAAPAGEVDVFAGLAGGGGAPMGNFTAAQPGRQPTSPPSSPASAPPPTSPQDTETIARQMIASGIPEVASQGIGLLSRIEAQQTAQAGRDAGFFAPFIAQDGRAYLPSKGGGPAQPLVDQQGNQLQARSPYDIRSVAGGVQAIDPLTAQARTVFTPEEVGRGEGLAQAATQKETDKAQARLELPALEQQTEEAFNLIDRLAVGGDLHQGFKDAYGFKRFGFTVPAGAPRRDAEAAIAQLANRLTLEETSKMTGVLSESDILLLARASTRLADTTISDKEALKALQEVRDAMMRARENVRRRAQEAVDTPPGLQGADDDALLRKYGIQ